MNIIVGLFLIAPFYLVALQKEPALPAPYTFEYNNSYTYQYVPTIDQAINPIDFHSHNNFYYTSLSGSFKEGQALFLGVGFNATSQSSFNFLEASIEYRVALLNQLLGDFVSVQIAPVITFVPHYRVTDVNTPYQNVFNASTILSLGAELDRGGDWIANFFLAAQGGISSDSGPFIDLELHASTKLANAYIFSVAVEELIGFGNDHVVNVGAFRGWSNIAHRSTKFCASFGYIVNVYGTLTLEFAYRPFSRSYLQNDSSLSIGYAFPFSP
jgi:hypothetical protein